MRHCLCEFQRKMQSLQQICLFDIIPQIEIYNSQELHEKMTFHHYHSFSKYGLRVFNLCHISYAKDYNLTRAVYTAISELVSPTLRITCSYIQVKALQPIKTLPFYSTPR